MTQSIGQRLKAAREEQKLTLEKAFEATRIRVPYLQALEADDFTSVPSPVQARGYLRNYAEYLGLDFQQLLDELREASTQKPSGEVIGPADEVEAEAESAPQPEAGVERTEAAVEVAEPAPEAPTPVDETPLPSGIKPPRRKKRPAASEDASAESTPERRGRNKPQPEPEPVPAPEPEAVVEPEPASLGAVSDEPADMEEPAAPPESTLEEVPAPTDDSPSRIASEDRIWQSWLNRVGAVLSARMKRRTIVTNDQTGVDEVITPEPAVVEPEPPPIEAPDARTAASSEIFSEIGQQLRERRELLSLHLDEVERNTHVKAHYLAALEKGAMDELPSTVQTRGMLSNYATFLDMDVDALLLRFADALQTRYRERNPDKPGRLRERPIIESLPPMRSFVAGDIVFGIGMAVLLVGFAIWGVSRVVELQAQQAVQPTAPSISDVLLASPDPADVQATQTLQPVESFPGLATVTIVIPTQALNVDVQLNLVAVERTYMRVEVDGEVAFEGRVVPGNAYPFQGESQIEVLVGSGAAIRAVYNGRDLGLLGTFGQIVTYIYTADQIVTPTSLPSPSPTNTEPPTPTVPPTSTPVPTNTAVPSRTPAP